MNMNNNALHTHEIQNQPIAEVIASDSYSFTITLWEWDTILEFGSLVTCDTPDGMIFGVVSYIQTGSNDSQRQPYPYRMPMHDLKREHPEIFEFLQTTATIHIIGFMQHNEMYYRLCQQPPLIHAFVRKASPIIIKRILSKPDYLYLLYGKHHTIANVDELFISLIGKSCQTGILDNNTLQHTLSVFMSLLHGDYQRIRQVAHRLQQYISL